MKILGIIPARAGSKGIPNKNIVNLAGKPLIAYTIYAAKKSKLITNLLVSTDSKKIAEVAKRYGADVPFLRPKKLAKDKSPMVPVVQHAINFLEKKNKEIFDYIVLLQPTSPLKTTQDIDSAIKMLIKTNADNVYSVTRLTQNTYHPLRIKKIEKNNNVMPFCSQSEVEGVQRQSLPVVYRRNGAIFAFSRDLIMNKNSIFGTPQGDTRAFIMPPERSIDIDSEFDLILAEYIISKNISAINGHGK